jgi:hypothetical protein
MADLPGGASGMLCRDYKGKRADRLVTRINPGVVSLVAETPRPRERQAAEELGQGKTHREERKAIDATSPAAVTLALLLTDEEGIGNALVERSSSREERRTDDRQ